MMTVRACGDDFSPQTYSVALDTACGGVRVACEADLDGAGGCTGGPGTTITLAVNALENIRIRVAMLGDDLALDGEISVSFQAYPACGVPTAGSCVLTHGNGGCADGDCCVDVCAADPFCSTDFWDALCVQRARNLCGCSPSDLNGDGVVNAADLATVPGSWTP